ncbi:MAG: alpha/beta hydrolase [Blastocatellia bacterium]|nr:alpha/beta hydrolase [Blastocatellia bacterium]
MKFYALNLFPAWSRKTLGILALCLSLLAIATESAQAQTPTAPKTRSSFKVEVTGKGKPMILIPGLSSSGEVWKDTVAHYSKHYECHVLTLAGFAGEPAIDGPFLETVRTDLAAYIRTKKLEKPVIVGHSLGGFLALWLATQEPSLPGRLVIVDSLPFLPGAMTATATPDSMKPQAEMMRNMIGNQTPEQWKAFQQSSPFLKSMIRDQEKIALAAKWGIDSTPKAVGQAMFEMYTIDLREEVAKIQVPTLVMGTWIGLGPQATKESVTTVFQTQYAKIKNHKLLISDTARHFIMFDDPEWMFQAIDGFLK